MIADRYCRGVAAPAQLATRKRHVRTDRRRLQYLLLLGTISRTPYKPTENSITKSDRVLCRKIEITQTHTSMLNTSSIIKEEIFLPIRKVILHTLC